MVPDNVELFKRRDYCVELVPFKSTLINRCWLDVICHIEHSEISFRFFTAFRMTFIG